MLQNFISIGQFQLTKWSFLVHSTTRNAPYIHPSHDSILELWWTFPNVYILCTFVRKVLSEGLKPGYKRHVWVQNVGSPAPKQLLKASREG